MKINADGPTYVCLFLRSVSVLILLINDCMTEWAILFERDVLFISSVVTRLTCPGRGEVHQWSPCHNARRKLGLTGGACANPVCDHPGLVTISNFSHFFLASAELSVSLNQPKYAIRNTLEVSLLLWTTTTIFKSDKQRGSMVFREKKAN